MQIVHSEWLNSDERRSPNPTNLSHFQTGRSKRPHKRIHRFSLELMELTRFLFLFASTIAVFVVVFVSAGEVEDEREFSYIVGSENGPERWSSLHHEWSACNNGKSQSPIDLADDRAEMIHHLGGLRRCYRASPAVIRNRGHDIMIKWTNGSGELWINGTEYILQQLHWHSPSEHTLNGRSFEAELHMVHQSVDGKIAVLGVLYEEGRPDPFLARMERYIHKLVDAEGEEEEIGMVNPRCIPKRNQTYYRYVGSLTTPPCTEGVLWTIISKVRTVSKKQVQLLREAVHDSMEKNARPEQPINERTLHHYLHRRNGY